MQQLSVFVHQKFIMFGLHATVPRQNVVNANDLEKPDPRFCVALLQLGSQKFMWQNTNQAVGRGK